MTLPDEESERSLVFAHEEQELRLRVRQLRWEAEGVVSVLLQRPDGGELPPWRPGAHIDLRLPGVITRQYSLCGPVDEPDVWQIAILREPNGRGGSAAVHDTLRPGDLVDVVGPRNNFALVDSPDYVFVAGGIGITPLLPMIETARAAGAHWQLTYGGRTRAGMAFVDDLAALGERVRIRPQDECGLLDLNTVIGPARAGTVVYCCGPEALLLAVEQACSGWPAGALHLERFKPKLQPPADPDADRAFDVVLAREQRIVHVPEGMAILEALEAAGIEPANSCREGICGTCETKVLDGIPDHRDSLLSDDERAANTSMMICVGRARCDRLVLDL